MPHPSRLAVITLIAFLTTACHTPEPGSARSGEAQPNQPVAQDADAPRTPSADRPRPRRNGTGEHRAFWCHSPLGVHGMSWDEAIKTLADNGFTAILPNMCWAGVAYYDSEVLPVSSTVKKRGDQIKACLAACKKHSIECHIWKVNHNLGGRRSASFGERMRREGRTQVRFDGKPVDWLCPSHPANQKLEIDAMVEIATKYDVDGIHFDYIRYPGAFACFCDGCRERFEAVIGERVAGWPNSLRRNGKHRAAWLAFRRKQITTIVASVAEKVRKASPDVEISAAVFNNWATYRNSLGQDWRLWCEKGYLDFVCPMDYFRDNERFEEMVARQLRWSGKVPCYPGIGLSVWRPRYDFDKLKTQIEITRRLKTGGFTVFNYDSVVATKTLPRFGRELAGRP